MEFASPTPRRVRRPKWLDGRLVLGLALVLAAVLIGAKVVGSADHTRHELALTRSLAAGTTVRDDDLAVVDAQLPDGSQVYVDDRAQIVGKTLNRPLAKGEFVPASALVSGSGHTLLAVPFAADTAPTLARGQHVIMWLSTASCPSVVLLPDVTIQDVHAADDGFGSSGTGQSVVISVDSDSAQRVETALAMKDATIRAGVLDDAPRPTSSALPSLAACAS